MHIATRLLGIRAVLTSVLSPGCTIAGVRGKRTGRSKATWVLTFQYPVRMRRDERQGRMQCSVSYHHSTVFLLEQCLLRQNSFLSTGPPGQTATRALPILETNRWPDGLSRYSLSICQMYTGTSVRIRTSLFTTACQACIPGRR